MMPKTTSRITKNIAIDNAKGTRKGRLKTGSPKYSANLYENPTGSFSFINPEIMNKIPTKMRENWVIMFFMFNFYSKVKKFVSKLINWLFFMKTHQD